MVPWLFFLLPIPTLAGVEKTYGVSPSLLSRYVPTGSGSSATWTCLDGSNTINWSSVNDDYCDCLDGSDEPGTGACPNTVFYCRNEGHVGAHIPSTRVGDGLCEPECCDGSDERPGVCSNKCKEVGEAYRQIQDAEWKIRKKGSKIRSSYISYAQKEKKRLEGRISTAEQEILLREKEVARLKDIADRAESLSAAALEHRRNSPLYAALIEHSRALKSLRREHKKHLEREAILGDILDALRTGYNPNYQDMAVLEAVRGWEYQAGLPHINDIAKEDESSQTDTSNIASEPEEVLEEGMWSADRLDRELDSLLDSDYESLLLEHDKHIGAPAEGGESVLFNLTAYIPDAFLPRYEALRNSIISWLETLGVVRGSVPIEEAETSRARQAFQDAERSLTAAVQDKQQTVEELGRLFDPEWFGPEGEWKKLQGTCLEKDTGDYTYEVCLFEEAKQKPNKGGASHTLGRFSSWNNVAGVVSGSLEYYSKQHYTRGTKCWNGPHRSVTLVMSCGTENAVLTVTEPEKCEYQFTVTSPALCLPVEVLEETREEL
ncbi:endoplasmic reticulum protein [Sparassis latifolia]|uniref:Glucosidase 2 subunit beta n=1 Tax=Sparassis crispa TaxID=139825 RepID=A0A401GAC7_9APHY|nr:Glucosidase 2 subunit beta [Sparassis crispa]GBE79118.1 Glucosidase 2 subunit beta [Sparassis crispa]